MRVLHFSDIHVQAPVVDLPARDWVSKRALGALHLLARRGRYFRDAAAKLKQLEGLRQRERAQLVICTGDYTALGTEGEHALARLAVEPLTRAPAGYLTVPGNHDVYLPDALAQGRFERHFGDLITSDVPVPGARDGWPWVRLVGESLAVIGVASARPNPHPLRSSGEVPAYQLRAVSELLSDARLADRWVFVLSHYGLLRRDGTPDTALHGLSNAAELGRACLEHPRAVVLHGHVHWCYHHPRSSQLPATFGAGSATHTGREGAWLFDVEPDALCATPCVYADGDYSPDPTRSVRLPGC